MEHLRIDPKFRRKPRPKKAGWAAREVFKFLLEVSAEFDLHGRFSKSMQDVEWLADEWANGDADAVPECAVMLTENLAKLTDVGLTHLEDETLVITDWDDFYKPAKTGAQRQADYAARKRETPSAVTEVTPVTATVIPDATIQHSTTQHSTPQTAEAAAAAAVAVDKPRGAFVLEKPAAPLEDWTGDDFWVWFQTIRQEAGLPAEVRRPHPRDLSSWWSACLMTPAVTPQALKRAVYAFGKDPYWEKQGFPFRGFMKQWDTFVSKEKARATAT